MSLTIGVFAAAPADAYSNNGWRWGSSNCASGYTIAIKSVTEGCKRRTHNGWVEGYGYTGSKVDWFYLKKSTRSSGSWGAYVSSDGKYRYGYCNG